MSDINKTFLEPVIYVIVRRDFDRDTAIYSAVNTINFAAYECKLLRSWSLGTCQPEKCLIVDLSNLIAIDLPASPNLWTWK
jgi:hypothetical protein